MRKPAHQSIPNTLSMVRLALIAPIIWLLYQQSETADLLAIGIIILAALSDVIDGYLARRWDSVTEWGKALDPIADKLLAASVVVALAKLGRFPEWAAWVIILRDAVILLGAAIMSKRLKSVVSSNRLGKLPAPFLVAAIVFHILDVAYLDKATLYLTLATMAVAAFSYAVKFVLGWNALSSSPKPLR